MVVVSGMSNSSLGFAIRDPRTLTSSTSASSAVTTAGSSAAGSAWAMLPPTVPRFRIATWPIRGAASARRGQAVRIRSSCSRIRCLTSAPEPQAVAGSDAVQAGNPVDVDDDCRRGETQVEKGTEALSAGEHLRVVAVPGEEVAGLLDRLRRVVVEAGRLQPRVPIVSTASSWKGSTLSLPTSRMRSIES